MLPLIFFAQVATAQKNAIVVPYHHDVLAPEWKRPVCSETYNSSTDLVIFIAKPFYGPEKSIETLDQSKWRCFNDVFITSGDLAEENNVYNKNEAEVDPW